MINKFNIFNLNLIGKKQFLRSYLLFAYFLIFFSVGENIVNINFNQNILELKNILHIRSIAPYLVLIINFILLVKMKVNNIFRSNLVISFFYLILLCREKLKVILFIISINYIY